MMVAGFRSGSLVHKNYYENKISIPSLHVYGLNDDIINHEMSEALVQCFNEPVVVPHQGGHFFPATAANEKEHYINFFQDQLQSYLEDREMKQNGVASQDQEAEDSQ
jgi:surfactin synthase thioesterase subunit